MARPRARASIDPDQLMTRPLGEISAAEFLEVLAHPKVRHPALAILPDKKKYELWVEEGPIGKISIGDFIDKLKGEKKKVELEVPPWFSKFPGPFRQPELEYGQLVDEIANVVEERLQGR